LDNSFSFSSKMLYIKYYLDYWVKTQVPRLFFDFFSEKNGIVFFRKKAEFFF